MSSPSTESAAHRHLKTAALVWAQAHGFPIAALEVAIPDSPYRADVAAYRPVPRHQGLGFTAILECKQARPDFLKDRHDLAATLSAYRTLQERKKQLESRLGLHRPHLLKGDSLFPEFDHLDPGRVPHHGFQKLHRELRVLEKRIHGRTKFYRMMQWRSANLFLLVAPRSVLDPSELPDGWGLLAPPEPFESDQAMAGEPCPLELITPPRWVDASPACRLETLQRIARQATRFHNRAAGIATPPPAPLSPSGTPWLPPET